MQELFLCRSFLLTKISNKTQGFIKNKFVFECHRNVDALRGFDVGEKENVPGLLGGVKSTLKTLAVPLVLSQNETSHSGQGTKL